jgi:uncharacterized protein RhaS with RHS repeats
MEGNQACAHFGQDVSAAGDVNGDGADDVLIGANLYDNGQANEGRAFVYHGRPITITGLRATNDSPTVSYTWAFGGDTLGSGAVVTHTYASAGSYTAVVTATNSANTVTVTTQVTVTYTYDPLNRLTGATYGTGETYVYQYDAGDQKPVAWAAEWP